MNNEIKTIYPLCCPSCGNDVLVEFVVHPIALSGVFTREEMIKAKTDAISGVRALSSVDKQKKQEVIDWINDPETIFGPGEVPHIIESLTKQT